MAQLEAPSATWKAEYDAIRLGIPIMRAFRRTPEKWPSRRRRLRHRNPHRGRGIRSRVIHRWPGDIGQKISPKLERVRMIDETFRLTAEQ